MDVLRRVFSKELSTPAKVDQYINLITWRAEASEAMKDLCSKSKCDDREAILGRFHSTLADGGFDGEFLEFKRWNVPSMVTYVHLFKNIPTATT